MRRRRNAAILLTTGVALAVATVPMVSPAGAQPSTVLPAAPADRAAPATFSARHSLRAPVTDENFYFVMADRFENGSDANNTGGISGEPTAARLRSHVRGFYNGGDLAGLLERIEYIRGLGTTSIWLTPSFKNKAVQLEDGPSAGYHGYWVTDFTQIDPHLGTNDELRALVDAAHARGMKVYFDIITNHTADVIGYEQGARTAYVPKDAPPTATLPRVCYRPPGSPSTTATTPARTDSRRSTRRFRFRTPRSSSRANRTSRFPTGSTT